MLAMKKMMMLGMTIVTLMGIQSCQKDEVANQTEEGTNAALTTSLTAAVTEVATTQVTEASTEDIQCVATEKFDGTDADAQIKGTKPARDAHGKFIDMGMPMKFDIPHISSCATVTVSSSTFPKEMTVDYGTGCSDGHGPKKAGKIIITMSDTLVTAGSVKTITYQDFTIDSMKVEMSAVIKNLGQNSDGHWIMAINADQKITRKSGKLVHEVYNDTTEWVQGFETTDKADDIYYKTGSGTMTINDSLVFSRSIIKPLLTDKSCDYVSSGIVELYRKGNTIVIDYGDGTCDSKATVTTNGTSEEIDLYTTKFKKNGHFGKNKQDGFGGKGQGRFGD
jgi:hypothetical protein